MSTSCGLPRPDCTRGSLNEGASPGGMARNSPAISSTQTWVSINRHPGVDGRTGSTAQTLHEEADQAVHHHRACAPMVVFSRTLPDRSPFGLAEPTAATRPSSHLAM